MGLRLGTALAILAAACTVFASNVPPEVGERAGVPGDPSPLVRLWELDKESRRGGIAVTPYRFNYILPYTFNATPNRDPLAASEPGASVQKQEVKFQISFKTKLWEDVLGKNADLWVTYTQVCFWQFYDFKHSEPFRETDYEPELLLTFRTDYDVLGLHGRYVIVGLNHQSNGRSDPASRSWNRAVANFGFERGNFHALLNTWYRIPEAENEDDNPRIEHYMGYGQVRLFTSWNGHGFGLTFRNNLNRRDNKGALQLDWSFPLISRVNGYVQFFNGYGENLLDYKASSNRIGAGFVLKEW